MKINILHLLLLICHLVSCKQSPKPETDKALNNEVGTIDRYEMMESEFIRPRNIDVWLPNDYNQETTYQVLYMHDGQNIFEPGHAYGGECWEVDNAIQSLIDEGEIPPTIVVGIWNTEDRTIEYTPSKPYFLMDSIMQDSFEQIGRILKKPASDEYLKFIVEELKPFIDSKYSTAAGRRNTYIAGSSMGGLISLYAQFEYSNVFGGAGCVSTHWPLGLDQNRDDFSMAYGKYLQSKDLEFNDFKLYFDYGTKTLDAWYKPHQQYIDSLFNGHIEHKGSREGGEFDEAEHNEKFWRQRFPKIAKYLLGNS
ncbi:MAG: alpha/beta hydrolase [Bacteroidia bacterium]